MHAVVSIAFELLLQVTDDVLIRNFLFCRNKVSLWVKFKSVVGYCRRCGESYAKYSR